MNKLHIPDARQQGFIIDDCCNPPIAYTGPRFQPVSIRECYTPLESELLEQLDKHKELLTKVAGDTSGAHAKEANTLLVALLNRAPA